MTEAKRIKNQHDNSIMFSDFSMHESAPVSFRNSRTFQDNDIFGNYYFSFD